MIKKLPKYYLEAQKSNMKLLRKNELGQDSIMAHKSSTIIDSLMKNIMIKISA